MIYFIQQGTNGPIKIGYSYDPVARLRALQTSHSDDLTLIIAVKGERETEKNLHRRFANKQLMGEWFAITNDDIAQVIRDVVVGNIKSTITEDRISVARILRYNARFLNKIAEAFDSKPKIFTQTLSQKLNVSEETIIDHLSAIGIHAREIRIGNWLLPGYLASDFERFWTMANNPFIMKRARVV